MLIQALRRLHDHSRRDPAFARQLRAGPQQALALASYLSTSERQTLSMYGHDLYSLVLTGTLTGPTSGGTSVGAKLPGLPGPIGQFTRDTRIRTGPCGVFSSPRLSYSTGNTERICQLIGDTDVLTQLPTRSQSARFFGIRGTDLGMSFEQRGEGRIYFYFGDTDVHLPTYSALTNRDSVAWLDASIDPETLRDPGLQERRLLNWRTTPGGIFDPITIVGGPQLRYDTAYVPTGGFGRPSQGPDTIYLFYGVPAIPNGSAPPYSILARSDNGQPFRYLYDFSGSANGPISNFIQCASFVVNAKSWGLEGFGSSEVIFVFGTSSDYRKSGIYLAFAPLDYVDYSEPASGSRRRAGGQWQYFNGLTASGDPIWLSGEQNANLLTISPPTAVLQPNGTAGVGELSVAYEPSVGLWIMTFQLYDGFATRVHMLQSAFPWGPWSPVSPDGVIYDPRAAADGGYGDFIYDGRDNNGYVMHDSYPEPYIHDVRQPDGRIEAGGVYGPYLIPRWSKTDGRHLSVYYTLSTNQPYTVVLMRSTLDVGCE